jgi:hypothetical protein
MHNLLPAIDIRRLSGNVAAGTDGAFAALSTKVDMLGYTGCMIVFQLGAIATDGVITTRVKNDATTTFGSGTVDQIGDDLANSADTDDNKFIVHDVYRPAYRYLEASYQRTVGNVTIDAVFAILYNGERRPITQSEVEAYQVLNNPTPSTT